MKNAPRLPLGRPPILRREKARGIGDSSFLVSEKNVWSISKCEICSNLTRTHIAMSEGWGGVADDVQARRILMQQ